MKNLPSDSYISPVLNKDKGFFYRLSALFVPPEETFKQKVQRPEGLPHKTPEELEKHAREIQEIERRIQITEIKESKMVEKQQKIKEAKENEMLQNLNHWREIVGNLDFKIKTAKTKSLFWHGIPSQFRAKVWTNVFPNDLNITPELFEIFCQHAEVARKDETTHKGKEATVQLIPLDLGRTFPALQFFTGASEMCHSSAENSSETDEDNPFSLRRPLQRILEAYACFRPDIGYVQGMSYIGAILILTFGDEFESFKFLANLLNHQLFVDFYKLHVHRMEKYVKLFWDLLFKWVPRVAANLEKLGILMHMVLMDWVLTLFSKSLNLDIAVRIWDLYLYYGEAFIFRAATGVFMYFEKELVDADYEYAMQFITHLPDIQGTRNTEEFFACVKKIKLSPEEYERALRKYSQPEPRPQPKLKPQSDIRTGSSPKARESPILMNSQGEKALSSSSGLSSSNGERNFSKSQTQIQNTFHDHDAQNQNENNESKNLQDNNHNDQNKNISQRGSSEISPLESLNFSSDRGLVATPASPNSLWTKVFELDSPPQDPRKNHKANPLQDNC